MISEIILSPCAFDESGYTNKEICKPILQQMRDILLNEALLTSMCKDEFINYLTSNNERWHTIFKNLLPNLITQNRFIKREKYLTNTPITDKEWIIEALEVIKNINKIDNIFISAAHHSQFKRQNSKIHSIENIHLSNFWQNRSCSKRLLLNTIDYINTLELILVNSNSIMFIDPYLDPSPARPCKEFIDILRFIMNNTIKSSVSIEIHLKLNHNDGDNNKISDWEKIFSKNIFSKVNNKLRIKVFIWDNFHDRYLISDLIGISIPYGFDTTSNTKSITTWTRLSRVDKDAVQKEFDENSVHHNIIEKPFSNF
jgi:hypothetical protein